VVASFRYTTVSGQLVIDGAPVTATPNAVSDGDAPLLVSWDGAWQVKLATAYGNSVLVLEDPCYMAFVVLATYLDSPGAMDTISYVVVGQATAPNTSDGCLLLVMPATPGAGVESLLPHAQLTPAPLLLMYRFGVLLAVGAREHAAFPYLPVVDVYEAALAQQLAASL
jgi:hypothetical protein